MRGVALAVLVIGGLTPLGPALLQRLESEVRPAAYDLRTIDGAVILGGAVFFDPRSAIGYELNAAGERITTAVALRTARPDLPIFFAGGSAAISDYAVSEAVVGRHALLAMGVDPTGVVFDDSARDTRGNALALRTHLEGASGVWLLVTSARHAPRALATFEAVFAETDLRFAPLPVDYDARSAAWIMRFDPAARMDDLHAALREYVGRVYYRARGWAD